ncbi:MAG: type II toxin-antitoxin system VapC family toxin [Zoogloeaceae bacterium]|nr:type II toxin-antitoxin system VapC family toxin [Zoogloeaceae bacterium]
MQVLLDTHAFLWWVEGAPNLGRKAREALADPDNECLLSLASVWELAIKSSLGKLQLALPVGRYVTEHVAANGFRVLGIELAHAARTEKLDLRHRDPFDRLLIAQALEEKLPVVTADPVFRKYGVKKIW